MDRQTYQNRRQDLCQRVKDGLILIPGARSIPLNIPMNFARFRQSSHLLYLCGLRLPDIALVCDCDAGQWTLFVPTPPEGDEIWHGKTPSPDHLREEIGAEAVEDIQNLEAWLQTHKKGRALRSPPCPDPAWVEFLKRVGDEGAAFNGQLDRHAPNPLADALIAMRNIKSTAEIALMQTAADVTVRAHRALMAATQVGGNEAQLHALARGIFTAAGCAPAYDPIITTRGDILHSRQGSAPLKNGNLILADIGAELPDGYCADVTRTYPVSGQFTPQQLDIYNIVLSTQRQIIKMIKPGVNYRALHQACCQKLTEGLLDYGLLKGSVEACLEANSHAIFFPHGLGHLLGMDVHDLEDLGDRAGYAPGRERSNRFGEAWLRLDRDLEAGMVVTIEPGLYFIDALLYDPKIMDRHKDTINFDRAHQFKGFGGIRIEDDIWVTDDGHKVLTAGVPKNPSAVESLVGSDPGALGILGQLVPISAHR